MSLGLEIKGCREKLEKITDIGKLNQFLGLLTAIERKSGGRRFIYGRKSYSLNQIVNQFQKCVLIATKDQQGKAVDESTLKSICDGLERIRNIDRDQAFKKVSKLTKMRQCLGNLWYRIFHKGFDKYNIIAQLDADTAKLSSGQKKNKAAKEKPLSKEKPPSATGADNAAVDQPKVDSKKRGTKRSHATKPEGFKQSDTPRGPDRTSTKKVSLEQLAGSQSDSIEPPPQSEKRIADVKEDPAAQDSARIPNSTEPKFLAFYAERVKMPLCQKLKEYFTLDEAGYIISLNQDVSIVQNDMKEHLDEWKKLFYEMAYTGDSGFGEEVRIAMVRLGIFSPQVSKATGIAYEKRGEDVFSDTMAEGVYESFRKNAWADQKQEAEDHKDRSAYLDAFSYSIWRGYRDYRHKVLGVVPKTKEVKGRGQEAIDAYNREKRLKDAPFTMAQLENYRRRCAITKQLHKRGELLARLTEGRNEQVGLTGHRVTSGSYSATLLPEEGSPINVPLFKEKFKKSKSRYGMLLDANRAHEKDFGIMLPFDGVTKDCLFWKQKTSKHGPGIRDMIPALSIGAQKDLLRKQREYYERGEPIHRLKAVLNEDQLGYTYSEYEGDEGFKEWEKHDLRIATAKSLHAHEVFFNEATFYAGAARSLWVSSFIRADQENYAGLMKVAIAVQDRMRRTKGLYIPIFFMGLTTNSLIEIPVDQPLLDCVNKEKIIHSPTEEVLPMPGAIGPTIEELYPSKPQA